METKERPSWDEYFLRMLEAVSARASCPRRQVGAMIVDDKHTLLAAGYNGPPSRLPNCTDHPCPGAAQESGNTTDCIALHAEHNAIHFAGDRIRYANTIYVSAAPCKGCALEILQTPIRRVIYLEEYADDRGVKLLRQGGVAICLMNI